MSGHDQPKRPVTVLRNPQPHGIKKLRELILELAVRGKLVPQEPNDEPASELLKRIAEEKARLVAEGQIKKQKPLTAITEEDQPFELPAGWEWASTATLALLITDGTHHTPTYISSGVPFISVKDIDGTTISFDNCKYISQEEHIAINARCNPELGDILLCRIGTLGRPTIVDTEVPFSLFVSVGLLKLPKKTELSRYFHCVLSSPLMYRQYDQIKAGGSHTNKLNLGDIPRLLVPVPPLAEQHRIVAKVDELMALCDRLEAQQADAESAHAQLVQALLDSLTQASDANDFAANWQRLAEHFHTLFTTEPSIDALKQTLLQLAVMGKLVPQDSSDEPASELLKRIAEEKARQVAEGKIKKQKPLPEITGEEKPFGLPASWEWVRLDALLKKIGAGSTPLGGKQGYVSEGIKFLRSQNVWNEGLRLNDIALIPESTHQKMSGTHVEAGDLLFNITGASIGRCAIVPDDFDTGNVSQHVSIVRPVAGELRHFLHVILTSQLVQQTVMDVQVGVSREGLSIGKPSLFVIPCPPEAEQHRIVAKVDQLMALCDQLKTHLTQARQLNEKLASTLVEQAGA
jgi:type I restriction enzyme S subunit